MTLDIAELRKLADQVESAMDSIKNPFAATGLHQEEIVIRAAEALTSALDEIDRLNKPEWEYRIDDGSPIITFTKSESRYTRALQSGARVWRRTPSRSVSAWELLPAVPHE